MVDKFYKDWSRFTIKTPIKASPEKVFSAWMTRDALESWFLRMAEYKSDNGKLRADDELIRVNDTFKWRWHGYPDEVMEEGKLLETNGKDFLKFSFGKAGIVSVKINVGDNETIVELTQEDIPFDESPEKNFHVGCKTGWTFYLANLNSVIQGGIDLRNKKKELYMD